MVEKIEPTMSTPTLEDLQKHYEQDPRYPCQYGADCYQKNPKHHSKYKHPPKKTGKDENSTTDRKRKLSNSEDEDKSSPKSSSVKHTKIDTTDSHDLSPSPERSSKTEKPIENQPSMDEESSSSNKDKILPDAKIENLISDLFLVQMPKDFYKFYDLCKELAPNDPCNAFKVVQIKLVGPYDVLLSKITSFDECDKDKFLRHWRYFYDPPEFQTVLKGNDKDGLHFGYWRDDPSEEPVFIVKNKANVECKIEPVAENIFGAMSIYLEEKLKLCNPFEKANVSRLIQKVKAFAKTHNFTLDSKTPNIQNREKKVVARTFHKVGIVVPYDKKTQLGYRELAVSDNDLKKILQRIDEAETTENKTAALSKLQEVVRFATIAADECDFGTCLELGHDLFSSGSSHVHNIAKSMLSLAYTHLIRQQFLKIVESHLQERKKGSDLSVI